MFKRVGRNPHAGVKLSSSCGPSVEDVYIREQFMTAKRRTRVLCVVAVIAVLMATLWPFNPFPRNGVTWLPGTSGLKFQEPAVVFSNGPLKPLKAESAESYTLELLLQPATARSSHTILAFYTSARPRRLLIRQWRDGLLVTHNAAVESDKSGTIKFDVDHVFHPGRLVFVTISSGSHGTTVYLDGHPAQSFPGFKISGSEPLGEIVLGTSPVSYHPWSGEVRGLAIYAKEFAPTDVILHYKQWNDPSGRPPDLTGAIARYSFSEAAGHNVHNEVASEPDLEIPATFSVPHKILLQSAVSEFSADRKYMYDVLTNIAGFVPLGLIVCAYFAWTRSRGRAILLSIVACGMLSFLIEILQYYIPRRGSGTTDIITNTLGAALGGVLLQTRAIRRLLEELKLIPGDQRSTTQ